MERKRITETKNPKTYRICFVSEFFFPNLGGVENHQYQLAQCLIERGHKVIVVTRKYGNRQGVRYLPNGLKVYYLNLLTALDQATLMTVWIHVPIFRKILIREQIQIVHKHQATSTLGTYWLIFKNIKDTKCIFQEKH